MGAEFHVGRWVKSLDELGHPKAALMDISTRQLVNLVGLRATPSYRRALDAVPLWRRGMQGRLGLERPGPLGGGGVQAGGDAPRWRDLRASRSGGGRRGRRPSPRTPLLHRRPARSGGPHPSPGRPAHALGRIAMCPPVRETDMTDRIEAQIERFAPGFRI